MGSLKDRFLWKEDDLQFVEEDSIWSEIGKKPLFWIGEALVCEVDGESVRDIYLGFPHPDDPQGFVLGGHHYRYSWIPESEIWIVRQSPLRGKVATGMFHEPTERLAMKYLGMSYDFAHSIIADCAEHVFRLGFGVEVESALEAMWERLAAA